MSTPRIGEFAWHPVSTRVNRVANDDDQLVLPISAEEMEAEAEAEAAKPKKVARKVAASSSDDGQGSLF
jgi:hypothetical protein